MQRANLTHSSLTAEKDDGEDTSCCLQADTSSQKLAGSRHYVYICVRTCVCMYIYMDGWMDVLRTPVCTSIYLECLLDYDDR